MTASPTPFSPMRPVPFGHSSARMVVREESPRLTDLPLPAVRDLFKEAGLILFRGFEGGAEKFKAFAGQFTRRFLRDLGGSKTLDVGGDYVQTLVAAGNPQDLHCESARGPNPPDLLWFHCLTPARTGGETTFADGVEIWQRLSEPTRSLFLASRLRYTEVLPPEQWRVGLKLFFLAELDHLNLGGTTFHFQEDGTLRMEFVTSAVRRTRWGRRLTFTNSLTGPYPGRVAFEDGTPVPAGIMAEIKTAHEQLIDQIGWQPGDLLMLDNSRYMHGRRGFTDRNRSHLTLMGIANFD